MPFFMLFYDSFRLSVIGLEVEEPFYSYIVQNNLVKESIESILDIWPVFGLPL